MGQAVKYESNPADCILSYCCSFFCMPDPGRNGLDQRILRKTHACRTERRGSVSGVPAGSGSRMGRTGMVSDSSVQAGYYPVISITDGTVEQIGWLEKGGWRIGIRSGNGNYYYYAHLHSYASEWKAGDAVQAGELLGYMGDSGYGPEGTTGEFPVHLHLGIYLPLGADQEKAVNPYWMLRYLESRKLTYAY